MLRARGIALLVTTFALASGSVALAPAAFAAAPVASISIDVSPDEATEGDTLEVTVTSTGTTDLYAYDLIFAYDPAVLEFDEESAVGPDGGFTTGALGDGLIAVTHTRLGTSPGLSGTVELASFSFRAIDGGDTVVALASAELVSSTDESVTQTDVDSASVSLVALPDPSPSPTSTPTESATPTPSASASATAVPVASNGQPLAATGADATPWLITGAGAVVLIAAGALLVIRRRQAVSE